MINNDRLVTLKPNVIIEPLVARWHAWPHLISPATSALNIPFRLIKQMESYVESIDLHEMACNSPELRGGPFLNINRARVNDIQQLINSTKENLNEQIAFGHAIKDIYRLLIKEADGNSIESLYNKLPEITKGYIELIYTLSGYPEIRVSEPFLYRSNIYNPKIQSAIMYINDSDERAFAFSTPRLADCNAIEINVSFASYVYNTLSKARTEPTKFGELIDALKLDPEDIPLFESFVIEAKSDDVKKIPSRSLKWKYFGHACILVESKSGRSALIDPVIPYNISHGIPRYSFEDLPDRLDYIVLTHNHSDHVSIESLLALRWKTDTVVVPRSGDSVADPSLKLLLQALGFNKVVELDDLESIVLDDISITALPFLGEHGDLNIRSKAAWLVTANDHKFIFAADSNNLDVEIYNKIHKIFGDIDTLFIGMECLGAPVSWVYGPVMPISLDRKKDQSRRLNGSDCSRGLEVVKSLNCKEAYIYAMGLEPWMQFITSIDPSEDTIPMINANEFMKKCNELGVVSQRLYGKHELIVF